MYTVQTLVDINSKCAISRFVSDSATFNVHNAVAGDPSSLHVVPAYARSVLALRPLATERVVDRAAEARLDVHPARSLEGRGRVRLSQLELRRQRAEALLERHLVGHGAGDHGLELVEHDRKRRSLDGSRWAVWCEANWKVRSDSVQVVDGCEPATASVCTGSRNFKNRFQEGMHEYQVCEWVADARAGKPRTEH